MAASAAARSWPAPAADASSARSASIPRAAGRRRAPRRRRRAAGPRPVERHEQRAPLAPVRRPGSIELPGLAVVVADRLHDPPVVLAHRDQAADERLRFLQHRAAARAQPCRREASAGMPAPATLEAGLLSGAPARSTPARCSAGPAGLEPRRRRRAGTRRRPTSAPGIAPAGRSRPLCDGERCYAPGLRRMRWIDPSPRPAAALAAAAAVRRAAAPRFTVEEMLKLDARVRPAALAGRPPRRLRRHRRQPREEHPRTATSGWCRSPAASRSPIARSEKIGRHAALVAGRHARSRSSRRATAARRSGWWTWGPAGPAGEPRKLTSLATEATGVAWSPDGKWMALRVRRVPGVHDARVQRAEAEGSSRRRKSKARVFDHLMFRHWMSWKDGPLQPPVPGARRRLGARRATSRPARPTCRRSRSAAPTTTRSRPTRASSPSRGRPTRSRRSARTATCSCSTSPTRRPRPRKITTNPAADGGPAYSPDGRFIAYRAQQRAGLRGRPLAADALRPEDGRASLDDGRAGTGSPDSYVWAPDSNDDLPDGRERGTQRHLPAAAGRRRSDADPRVGDERGAAGFARRQDARLQPDHARGAGGALRRERRRTAAGAEGRYADHARQPGPRGLQAARRPRA